MAESSLSIAYSDLAAEVTRTFGWLPFAQWTSENTADFTRMLKGGLRKFYWPSSSNPEAPRYEWSFLRAFTTQATTADDYDYTLPDNFSGYLCKGSVTYGVATNLPRLAEKNESTIRVLRSGANARGVPKYYAIRPIAYAPTTGQRYEMIVYPTPDAVYTIHYCYIFLPDVITSVNQYPVGGALYSAAILAAVLSEGERLIDDNPNGPYLEMFNRELAAAMRVDAEMKSS